MVFGKKGMYMSESKKMILYIGIGVVLGLVLAYLVPAVFNYVGKLLAGQGISPIG